MMEGAYFFSTDEVRHQSVRVPVPHVVLAFEQSYEFHVLDVPAFASTSSHAVMGLP